MGAVIAGDSGRHAVLPQLLLAKSQATAA